MAHGLPYLRPRSSHQLPHFFPGHHSGCGHPPPADQPPANIKNNPKSPSGHSKSFACVQDESKWGPIRGAEGMRLLGGAAAALQNKSEPSGHPPASPPCRRHNIDYGTAATGGAASLQVIVQRVGIEIFIIEALSFVIVVLVFVVVGLIADIHADLGFGHQLRFKFPLHPDRDTASAG